MYFWKTHALAEAIKNDKLSERDWKNYYLATSLFMIASMYLSFMFPRAEGTAIILSEAVLIVAITIIGINATFKTNEFSGGKNFIARITALGFPILIKIFILNLLGGVLMGVLEGALGQNNNFSYILITIFTLLSQVVFFWRINFYLKFINTLEQP